MVQENAAYKVQFLRKEGLERKYMLQAKKSIGRK
jgi:hypothetical protein